LRQGAESQDPRVRVVVAKLLSRLAKEGGEVGIGRLSEHGLLEASEALLMDEDTGIAEAAAGTFRAVMQYPAWREAALGAVDRLQNTLAGMPDVQRMRVLHLFIDIGRGSEDAFKALEGRGSYRHVLGAFITDDILLKMVSVELMDSLGSFPAGQDFLSREGVPEQLALNLTDPMCDDSVRLCVVRLLSFIIRRNPTTMAKLLPGRESPLAQTIAGMLETSGSESTERLTAMNAWANISLHATGLAFFLQWEGRLNTILGHVSSMNNEVCKGAMAAWSLVLEDRPPPSQIVEVGTEEAPAMMLWEIAERRLLPAVVKNLQFKPFPDVRFHAWNLLALLVQSRAAAQIVVPSQEVRDLMLDFTSELDSQARIAKHDFVKALLRHNDQWLAAFLDEKVMKVVEEYARQSAHWVPRTAAVSVGQEAA